MQEDLIKKTDYELIEMVKEIGSRLAEDELVKRYRHLVYEIVDHSFTSEQQTGQKKATLIRAGFRRLHEEIQFYSQSRGSFNMRLAMSISEEIQGLVNSLSGSSEKDKEKLKNNSKEHLECLYNIVLWI